MPIEQLDLMKLGGRGLTARLSALEQRQSTLVLGATGTGTQVVTGGGEVQVAAGGSLTLSGGGSLFVYGGGDIIVTGGRIIAGTNSAQRVQLTEAGISGYNASGVEQVRIDTVDGKIKILGNGALEVSGTGGIAVSGGGNLTVSGTGSLNVNGGGNINLTNGVLNVTGTGGINVSGGGGITVNNSGVITLTGTGKVLAGSTSGNHAELGAGGLALYGSGGVQTILLSSLDGKVHVFGDAYTFENGGKLSMVSGIAWADNQGLWVMDTSGNPAFGISAVDGKTWGSTPLDKGDVLIGNDSNYVKWDASAANLSLSGTFTTANDKGSITISAGQASYTCAPFISLYTPIKYAGSNGGKVGEVLVSDLLDQQRIYHNTTRRTGYTQNVWSAAAESPDETKTGAGLVLTGLNNNQSLAQLIADLYSVDLGPDGLRVYGTRTGVQHLLASSTAFQVAGNTSLHGAPVDANVGVYAKGIGASAATRGLRVLNGSSSVTLDVYDDGQVSIPGSLNLGAATGAGTGELRTQRSDGGYQWELIRTGTNARTYGLAISGSGEFIIDDVTNTRRLMTLDANTNAWFAPVLQSGWTNYDVATFNAAGYSKDASGVVHLRGLLKSGTVSSSTPMFVLPVGFRPASGKQWIFPVASNDAFGQCRIYADGSVVPFGGSNVWFSIDNISFPTY